MSNAEPTVNGHTLAIYYEHPEWFAPLFAELDQRGLAYDRLFAYEHRFDPAIRTGPYLCSSSG